MLSFKESAKDNPRPIAISGNKIIFVHDKPIKGGFDQWESNDLIEIIPDPKDRQCIYLASESGGGKTTYAVKYIKKYMKMFPARKVVIFTARPNDPAFDEIRKISTVDIFPIDDNILTYELQEDDFSNAIVLFDDIDSLEDKYFTKLFDISKKLLKSGRHDNAYIINTSHELLDRGKTKTQVKESHFIAFNPYSMSCSGRRLLTTYMSILNQMVNHILATDSRWITIYNRYPRVCITDKKIFMPGRISVPRNNAIKGNQWLEKYKKKLEKNNDSESESNNESSDDNQ